MEILNIFSDKKRKNLKPGQHFFENYKNERNVLIIILIQVYESYIYYLLWL